MKLTLFALLAAFCASGCTNTLYTHRKDFTAPNEKGHWHDYNRALKEGRQWEAPKEEKKK